MVHTAFSLVLRATLIAAALSFAAQTHAELYKWVDQNGNVTVSNAPPQESAQARQVEKMDENRPATAVEMRTRQILEDEARERRAVGAAESEAPGSTPGRRFATGDPDPEARAVYEWVPRNARSAGAPASGGTSTAGSSLPDSASVRYPPATPVTVRDPCLVSADPRCYEMNAASYDPYLGYAPARAEAGPPPVGATRQDAAGAVSAFRGLPPGTAVLPISR